MTRTTCGVIRDGKFYRIPEDSEALRAASAGESRRGTTIAYSQKRPGKSIAMSVHPSDCDRMNKELERRGVHGVHYDPSKKHNCIIESRAGRRALMREFGSLVGMCNVHDEDGGYGDG